jgi:hypothetical protein
MLVLLLREQTGLNDARRLANRLVTGEAVDFFKRWIDVGDDPVRVGDEDRRHGSIEPELELAQIELGLLALCDVAGNANQPDDVSLRIAQRHFGGGIPALLAIRAHIGLFVRQQALAFAQDLRF